MSTPRPSEADVEAEWFEGGDGHGYRYQYIGPIHYLCECGGYFLNRDRWIGHKAIAARDAEHEREVADLKAERDWHHARVDVLLAKEAGRVALRGGKPGDYWKGWHVDHCAAAQAAEAAEHALADLRAAIEALDRSGRMSFDHSDLRALLPRDDAAGGAS